MKCRRVCRRAMLFAMSTIGVAVLAAGALTGCSGSGKSSAAPSSTVWLCRPAAVNDPCVTSLTATSLSAYGTRTIDNATDSSAQPVDCFYVYPTVSSEPSANSDLKVQAGERDVATEQASRFSSVCRVWAPMYRQRTGASLAKGLGKDPNADANAYKSLLTGWNDYLAHDNNGRPIVFIGHSQGTSTLIKLLESQVDNNPSLRARTVAAILLGGNVTVPIGKTVGATFKNLPLCTASGQDGCVIAYSSYPSQPTATSMFGRPGAGVSLMSGQLTTSGVQVACVNPASLAGGTAALSPYFISILSAPATLAITTPWVTYPNLYSATCTTANGASWLQVTSSPGDTRPVVTQTLGPDWGYHIDDVNLALGDLVTDVQRAIATYQAAH